jgi:hypothetical protein
LPGALITAHLAPTIPLASNLSKYRIRRSTGRAAPLRRTQTCLEADRRPLSGRLTTSGQRMELMASTQLVCRLQLTLFRAQAWKKNRHAKRPLY